MTEGGRDSGRNRLGIGDLGRKGEEEEGREGGKGSLQSKFWPNGLGEKIGNLLYPQYLSFSSDNFYQFNAAVIVKIKRNIITPIRGFGKSLVVWRKQSKIDDRISLSLVGRPDDYLSVDSVRLTVSVSPG